MQTIKNDFNCEFIVEGMHCAACELLIEKKLSKVEGIEKVDAVLSKNRVYIKTNKDLKIEELNLVIENDGYKIVQDLIEPKHKSTKQFLLSFLISILIFALFLLIQKTGIINATNSNSEITLPFIFVIGIIASLSTCMAIVGGLVLSLSTVYSREHKFMPLVEFHISRLVSFFILGGVIGLIGSAATLTPFMTFTLNLILFLVMMVMAFNLLEVFSFTKSFQLRMPKYIGRKVIENSDTQGRLTPILLGAATFFLPCGFTQSMQLYSLTTGTALSGAITMLVFALGTLPVLALISFASIKLSKSLQSGLFYKTSAFLIIFFAIFNLITALISIGVVPPIFNM